MHDSVRRDGERRRLFLPLLVLLGGCTRRGHDVRVGRAALLCRHTRLLRAQSGERSQADARPAFSINNVDGAEFFRIKTPKGLGTPVFALNKVADFKVTASRNVPDTQLESVEQKKL